MFSLSLERWADVSLRLRGRARPWIMRVWKALSDSLPSESESAEDSSDASPTLLKSAQIQPRGDSSRISPHSCRSFMPEPARKTIRVGV